MDKNVETGKSLKWQEREGREIISVNIDKVCNTRRRVGSGVIRAHKKQFKAVEERLRQSRSSQDATCKLTENLTKVKKNNPHRLPPIGPSIKEEQREVSQEREGKSVLISKRNVLPPIRSSIRPPRQRNYGNRHAGINNNVRQRQCQLKAKQDSVVPQRGKTNGQTLIKARRQQCSKKDSNIRIRGDIGICKTLGTEEQPNIVHSKQNGASFVNQSSATRNAILNTHDSVNEPQPAVENQSKVKYDGVCDKTERQRSFIQTNRRNISTPDGLDTTDEIVGQHEYPRDSKPICSTGSSQEIIKFYNENFPLLMNTVENPNEFPFRPVLCETPDIFPSPPRRSRPFRLLQEFDNEDFNVLRKRHDVEEYHTLSRGHQDRKNKKH